MLRPVNAAPAAPVTPIRGNGPQPKIRHGSSTRLMMFDTQSSRIAIAASPAPRKIALFKKSSMIAPPPPTAIRAYPDPTATTLGDAPIHSSSFGARNTHGSPTMNVITKPSTIACTAATAAPSGSFSPMRRATIAVVDIESPSPTAKTRLSIDSVNPIVATASAPSLPTQNTSTTANRDSSTISKTIGMARSKIARFKLTLVKSWCDLRSASRIDGQIGIGFDSSVACCVSIYAFAFLRQCHPMRMHARGCTYTIRKNVEGTGSARLADLGNDRGYDDDLHLISPVIVALRGNIALQRKTYKRV